METLTLGGSKIESYLGIDKREGLVAIAKRLLQSRLCALLYHTFSRCLDVRRNDMIVSWQKSFKEDDRVPRSQAQDVLALSAFSLSSIPTPSSRRALVKEMWESGAHTIVRGSDEISWHERSANNPAQVIIDHKTPAGFECVAKARQFLLDMGSREAGDPETADWDIRGCHVVAPVGPQLREPRRLRLNQVTVPTRWCLPALSPRRQSATMRI